MTRVDIDLANAVDSRGGVDMICGLVGCRGTHVDGIDTIKNSVTKNEGNSSPKNWSHRTRYSFNQIATLLFAVGIILAGIGSAEASPHRGPITNGLREIARDVAFLKEYPLSLKNDIPTANEGGPPNKGESIFSDYILSNVIIGSYAILGAFMMAYAAFTIVNCKFLGIREFFTIDDSREPSVTDIAVSWFSNMLQGGQPIYWNPTISFFIVIAVVLSSFGGSNASEVENLPINIGINEIAKDVPPLKSLPSMNMEYRKLASIDQDFVDDYDTEPIPESVVPTNLNDFLNDYETLLNWAGVIAIAAIISSTIALVLGFMYSKMLNSRDEFPKRYNKPNRKAAEENTKSSRPMSQGKNKRK